MVNSLSRNINSVSYGAICKHGDYVLIAVTYDDSMEAGMCGQRHPNVVEKSRSRQLQYQDEQTGMLTQ